MRRTALSTTLLSALAICLVAAPCSTLGPTSKTFGQGALVIPMDNCYQRRDASTPNQSQSCTATTGRDDGVFRAYGLVYFLLKHGIPVYWAIDGATPKATQAAADVTIAAPASGAVVKKYNWSTGAFGDFYGTGQPITYLGGPFLIAAENATAALALLQGGGDFAPFKSQAMVDIHQVQAASFTAAQVRPLSGSPPRIAILNINPNGGKTSSNVMYQYAVAAGLSWPCVGNGDCAGGLGAGCSKQAVLDYLANPGGDTAIPQVCAPAGCTSGSAGCFCAPNFNSETVGTTVEGRPGLIYDLLCDNDFVPPGAGKTYADTNLAKGDYKLLWIPHWETGSTPPTGYDNASATVPLPPVSAADRLAWQLKSIASYVNAGNNLFVECLGIQSLEGVPGQESANDGETGIPATRFQGLNGMKRWNHRSNTGYVLQPLLEASHPNVQIGDFTYSIVGGAITDYYPDGTLAPSAAYRQGVERLITSKPATTPPFADVASTIQVQGADSVPRGNVAYLGGHDYSPEVGCTPLSSSCNSGETAGTRIVLNTLFNLGFACADPTDSSGNPVSCNTGLLGVCATGHLRCASGGGLQCVPDHSASTEICDGLDNDCNGLIDEGGVCNAPVCTSGATESCYNGPPGTTGNGQPCKAGTRTCTGGFWGPCEGEVLPTPEACNGKDDDCNGTADDGNLCAAGTACTSGVCLPTTCNSENARCPNGFTCTSSHCVAIPCPTTACSAGKVCQSGACVDPCASVQCGYGAACSGGTCVAGGCALTGCSAGLVCVNGFCEADPCATAQCPEGTFCRLGDCVRSCAYVECASGQSCSVDGFCEPDCSPACATGQICSKGTCQTDPCASVTCGVGQVCQQGACVDDGCAHVTCTVGTCSSGQCTGGGVKHSETHAVASAKGGGCASGGQAGLLSLALIALLLRRLFAGQPSTAPAPVAREGRRELRSGALLSAAWTVLALGASGCSSSSSPSCKSGQTACGSTCVDLTSAVDNCGTCGRACLANYQCVASGCVLNTGNPYLSAVDTSTVAFGSQVTFKLTTVGLAEGAHARLTGLGIDRDVAVLNPTTSPTATIDFSGARLGTATLRVANPVTADGATGWLLSNGLPITVGNSMVLRGITPAGATQDQAGSITLALVGAGFVDGAKVSMTSAAGQTQQLATTFGDASQLSASGIVPGQLAVGAYDIKVTNPDGTSSTTLKFTLTEGAPTLSAIDPTCIAVDGYLQGTATGSNFYPTSVVRVSGGSIVNSPLTTECLSTTDAYGRCADGKVRVTADLKGVPANCYTVTVVNPGASPQVSAAMYFLVTADCAHPSRTCP